MAQAPKQNQVVDYPLHNYYSKIYKRYDLVNRLFTFGQDKRWRHITATKCLEYQPAKVIDLCCGTGDMAILLSKSSSYPIEIVAFDFNHYMLALGRGKIKKLQIENIEFIQGDVAAMTFKDDSFDCITIAFGFRNLTFNNKNIGSHMNEINRILKSGGHLLILESSVPDSLLIRFLFRLYLKLILIPLGGLISGSWRAYGYLAKSAVNFFSFDQLNQLMKAYGFTILSTKRFLLGAANIIIVRKQ